VLERAVGHRLVRRATRGRPLALTPAGECLSRLHRTLEAALGAAREDIDAIASGEATIVRVGCAFSLPQLAAAVIEMRRRHPEIAVEVVRRDGDEQVATLLEAGALDAAVVRSCTRIRATNVVAAVSSPYVCLAPPLWRVAQRKSALTLADLEGYPRVVTADGTALGDGSAPIVVADMEMLVELVAGGTGVAIVPALLAPRTRRVVRRPLRESFPAFELTVAAAAIRTRPAESLLALIRSTLNGSKKS
jgi:DNA-binding transcriptional LysR family regulator